MCDTFVALGPVTKDGLSLFAKNSDRPPRECQRIVQLARRANRPGARVRCQYVEIPDAPETAAMVGSQPYWLWGLEHGVNEHRVAIGNQTVYTVIWALRRSRCRWMARRAGTTALSPKPAAVKSARNSASVRSRPPATASMSPGRPCTP